MNILKLYNKVLKQPLSENEEQYLLELIERYPYYSLLYVILSIQYEKTKHPNYKKVKTQAVLHAPDQIHVSMQLKDKLRVLARLIAKIPNYVKLITKTSGGVRTEFQQKDVKKNENFSKKQITPQNRPSDSSQQKVKSEKKDTESKDEDEQQIKAKIETITSQEDDHLKTLIQDIEKKTKEADIDDKIKKYPKTEASETIKKEEKIKSESSIPKVEEAEVIEIKTNKTEEIDNILDEILEESQEYPLPKVESPKKQEEKYKKINTPTEETEIKTKKQKEEQETKISNVKITTEEKKENIKEEISIPIETKKEEQDLINDLLKDNVIPNEKSPNEDDIKKMEEELLTLIDVEGKKEASPTTTAEKPELLLTIPEETTEIIETNKEEDIQAPKIANEEIVEKNEITEENKQKDNTEITEVKEENETSEVSFKEQEIEITPEEDENEEVILIDYSGADNDDSFFKFVEEKDHINPEVKVKPIDTTENFSLDIEMDVEEEKTQTTIKQEATEEQSFIDIELEIPDKEQQPIDKQEVEEEQNVKNIELDTADKEQQPIDKQEEPDKQIDKAFEELIDQAIEDTPEKKEEEINLDAILETVINEVTPSDSPQNEEKNNAEKQYTSPKEKAKEIANQLKNQLQEIQKKHNLAEETEKKPETQDENSLPDITTKEQELEVSIETDIEDKPQKSESSEELEKETSSEKQIDKTEEKNQSLELQQKTIDTETEKHSQNTEITIETEIQKETTSKLKTNENVFSKNLNDIIKLRQKKLTKIASKILDEIKADLQKENKSPQNTNKLDSEIKRRRSRRRRDKSASSQKEPLLISIEEILFGDAPTESQENIIPINEIEATEPGLIEEEGVFIVVLDEETHTEHFSVAEEKKAPSALTSPALILKNEYISKFLIPDFHKLSLHLPAETDYRTYNIIVETLKETTNKFVKEKTIVLKDTEKNDKHDTNKNIEQPIETEELKRFVPLTAEGQIHILPEDTEKNDKHDTNKNIEQPIETEELKRFVPLTAEGQIHISPEDTEKNDKHDTNKNIEQPIETEDLKRFVPLTAEGQIHILPEDTEKNDKHDTNKNIDKPIETEDLTAREEKETEIKENTETKITSEASEQISIETETFNRFIMPVFGKKEDTLNAPTEDMPTLDEFINAIAETGNLSEPVQEEESPIKLLTDDTLIYKKDDVKLIIKIDDETENWIDPKKKPEPYDPTKEESKKQVEEVKSRIEELQKELLSTKNIEQAEQNKELEVKIHRISQQNLNRKTSSIRYRFLKKLILSFKEEKKNLNEAPENTVDILISRFNEYMSNKSKRIKPQLDDAYEEAKEPDVKPAFIKPTETLAKIFEKRNEIDKAIEIYEKLIAIYPDKKEKYNQKIAELRNKN